MMVHQSQEFNQNELGTALSWEDNVNKTCACEYSTDMYDVKNDEAKRRKKYRVYSETSSQKL